MKALAAVALLLLAVPLVPPAAAATGLAIQEAHWGTGDAASPGDASPGDRDQILTVTLENTGTSALSGVTATFRAVNSILTPHDPATAPLALATDLDPGKTWAARFHVDIAQAATLGGTYAFQVMVTGTDTSSKAGESGTLAGTITVPGAAHLALSAPTASVPADATTTLHLLVANTGTVPADASVAFTGRGLTIAAPTGPVALGEVPAGGKVPVTVTVGTPDTLGVANLTATFSFLNTQGTYVQQASTVALAVGGASVSTLRVGLREQQLSIGRANTLHFTVTNTGATDLASVTVAGRFASSGTTASSVAALNASDVQSIASLTAGASAPVQMSVLVSSSATGLASFTVTASGTDADGAVSGTYDFAVALVGTVEFSVGTVTETADGAAGTVTVAGTFTNLGNTQAHNVYLMLAGAAFGQTAPQYLGDVDANSATPFSVTTRLLNGTALPAAGGGFGTGQRGTFTGPPGGFGGGGGGGFGNRSRNGGFGGGGRGGQQVRLTLSWNDDYGSIHTQEYNASSQLRTATARAATTTGSAGTLGGVASRLAASPWTWLVAAAGVGGLVYWRRRAGRAPGP
jgi:hypothetical protein